MRNKKLAMSVRNANITIFDSKDFDKYQTNPSIYEPARQSAIRKILMEFASPHGRLLDIGCGTGNILNLARGCFKTAYGLDVSFNLLKELKQRSAKMRDIFYLALGEAGFLPYKENIFDFACLYGVLHHIANHKNILKEICRVLKNGGVLYTDHDPNYFFCRFYSPYYRLRHLRKPGFGTHLAELSEYHHTYTSGINTEQLKKEITEAGFGTCQVNFRITTNPKLPLFFKFIRTFLRLASSFYPARSFYTHFSVIARK
jgi:ubiquinone/menaquinone biosynthesis C-methylase UbiE